MDWSKKRMIICMAAFVVLLGILIGKACLTNEKREDTGTYATEDTYTESPEEKGGEIYATPAVPEIKEDKKPGTSRTTKSQTHKTFKKNTKTKKETQKKDVNRKEDKKKGKEKKKNRKPEKTIVPTVAPRPTLSHDNKSISFEIQCYRIMNKKENWKDGIEEVIPKDGVFYQGNIDIKGNETVYDLLKQICKAENILLDSEYTPLYGTYYIKGIGNLYEFDCGAESGWKYSVNGKLPSVGCSSYKVKEGDQIIFFYDDEY